MQTDTIHETEYQKKPAKAVLEVQSLNLWYGKFHALKGVSMDILEQEVTALIGPSGCGKSTLIRCLNRMNDFN